MAVALDATGTELLTASPAASPVDYSGLTVGAALSNGALVALIESDNQSALTSVTWDQGGTNQAMTLVSSGNTSGALGRGAIWALRNPTSGNKTMRLVFGAGRQFVILALSFTGVNQTSDAAAFPHAANVQTAIPTNTAQACTVTVTSATGNMVVAVHSNDANGWGSTNQTQLVLENGTVNSNAAMNRASGAASVAMTATSISAAPTDTAVSVGVDIAASGGDTLQGSQRFLVM